MWAPTLFPRELPDEQRRLYPSRPTRLDVIPPFFPDMVEHWERARAYRPPPDTVAPATTPPRPASPFAIAVLDDTEEPGPTDEKVVKEALERADRAMNRRDIARAQKAGMSGRTPKVNEAIATLRRVTLNDIKTQAGVQFPYAWGDRPLIEDTEIILYHSVCSFVLDKHGEPFDVHGRLDYPILVPEPGSQMKRHCPPPGGVFVSVQKVGFQNFRIANGRIDKVLEGGVGGFEEYGYGYSGPHAYQQRIQAYLDGLGGHVFIAGITAPAAITREEITFDRITSRVPEFADAVLAPLVKEVRKRAKNKIENWQEFLEQIAEEVIRTIIIDAVKERLRHYIIKKVGVRIVPGLNAAAAVYDLATGGTERMRVRNAIACIVVALRSDAEEDTTIAAKVCARIVADAFEDKIMAAIVNAGTKAVRRAGKHIAIKVRGAGEGGTPSAQEAGDEQESAEPTAHAHETAAAATRPGVEAGAATPGSETEGPASRAPAEGAGTAPPPGGLSLTAGGPAPRAPMDERPSRESDEPARRAVAEAKQKIHEDLRARAEEAVRGSAAPADPAPSAAGIEGQAPAVGVGSENGPQPTRQKARGTDDRATAFDPAASRATPDLPSGSTTHTERPAAHGPPPPDPLRPGLREADAAVDAPRTADTRPHSADEVAAMQREGVMGAERFQRRGARIAEEKAARESVAIADARPMAMAAGGGGGGHVVIHHDATGGTVATSETPVRGVNRPASGVPTAVDRALCRCPEPCRQGAPVKQCGGSWPNATCRTPSDRENPSAGARSRARCGKQARARWRVGQHRVRRNRRYRHDPGEEKERR